MSFIIRKAKEPVAWDDPDLGIDWRIPREKVALSEKDKGHKRLKEQIDTEVFCPIS